MSQSAAESVKMLRDCPRNLRVSAVKIYVQQTE